MASAAEIILNSFLEIAGEQWTGVGIADLLRVLAAAPQPGTAGAAEAGASGLSGTLARVAAAVLGGSLPAAAALPVAGGNTGSSGLGRVVSAVFGSALGLAPVAKAIVSLFTGGSSAAAQEPARYTFPPRLRFEAANAPGPGLRGVDYGQDGLPRAHGREQTFLPGQESPRASYGGDAATYAAEARAAAPAQITVQVNAMDSRSFLDHKEEIARAVREAMLNMHSLNDVVSDL